MNERPLQDQISGIAQRQNKNCAPQTRPDTMHYGSMNKHPEQCTTQVRCGGNSAADRLGEDVTRCLLLEVLDHQITNKNINCCSPLLLIQVGHESATDESEIFTYSRHPHHHTQRKQKTTTNDCDHPPPHLSRFQTRLASNRNERVGGEGLEGPPRDGFLFHFVKRKQGK